MEEMDYLIQTMIYSFFGIALFFAMIFLLAFFWVMVEVKVSNNKTKKERIKAETKIKEKFLILESEKWQEQMSKTFLVKEEISEILARTLEIGVDTTEEERRNINNRIKNLNELINKKFQYDIELEAVEKEIMIFQKELEDGEFFEEYNKKVRKKIKEASKFKYKGYVSYCESKVEDFKDKTKNKNKEIYEYIEKIESFKEMKFTSKETKNLIDDQMHAIAYYYLESGKREEEINEKEKKMRIKKIKDYARK